MQCAPTRLNMACHASSHLIALHDMTSQIRLHMAWHAQIQLHGMIHIQIRLHVAYGVLRSDCMHRMAYMLRSDCMACMACSDLITWHGMLRSNYMAWHAQIRLKCAQIWLHGMACSDPIVMCAQIRLHGMTHAQIRLHVAWHAQIRLIAS